MKSKDMGYSMPVIAPIYHEPPYLYRGGNSLICVYRTKEEILKQIVPEPLKPAEGNLVFAWINKFNTIGLGPYNEAIISTPVEFQGTAGNYMVYLYLDSDTPIMAGREIWGFPKKAGHFTLSEEAEVVTRSVERGGVDTLRISVQMTRAGKPETLGGLGNPIYNLKLIPSVKKGAPPDVMQITANTLQNIAVHKIVEGNATLSLGVSPADPLYLIEPVEILQGIYCEVDFDLTYGEVVHDYKG
jgi:acetoacetate decarboxylase